MPLEKLCRNTRQLQSLLDDDEVVSVRARVKHSFATSDCGDIEDAGGEIIFVNHLPDCMMLSINIKVGGLPYLCDIPSLEAVMSNPPVFPHQHDLGGEG